MSDLAARFLGRVDTSNLTQWREGAKAQRCDYCAVIPAFYPRHSRESGNPGACSQARRPKSRANPNSAIPAKTGTADPLSLLAPVIPAKAGIQMLATKLITRNQVQIAVSGSPLPLWERARVRVSRVSAAPPASRPRSQRLPSQTIPQQNRAFADCPNQNPASLSAFRSVRLAGRIAAVAAPIAIIAAFRLSASAAAPYARGAATEPISLVV